VQTTVRVLQKKIPGLDREKKTTRNGKKIEDIAAE